VTLRTDLYQPGGPLLFHLLTGRLPVEGGPVHFCTSVARKSASAASPFRADVDCGPMGSIIRSMAVRPEYRQRTWRVRKHSRTGPRATARPGGAVETIARCRCSALDGGPCRAALPTARSHLPLNHWPYLLHRFSTVAVPQSSPVKSEPRRWAGGIWQAAVLLLAGGVAVGIIILATTKSVPGGVRSEWRHSSPKTAATRFALDVHRRIFHKPQDHERGLPENGRLTGFPTGEARQQ